MNLQPKDIQVSLVQADHEQNLGQWSMQTYSGVVLYHKPTGIQVKCTKHKSQYKNKADAMRILEERVGESFYGKMEKLTSEYEEEMCNFSEDTCINLLKLYNSRQEDSHFKVVLYQHLKHLEKHNDQTNS